MTLTKIASASIIACILTACGGGAAGAAPRDAPPPLPADTSATYSSAEGQYGSLQEQVAKLYVPDNGGINGLLVWVPAAGQATGDEELGMFENLVRKGIAVISVGYRSSFSDFVFPQPTSDVTQVLNILDGANCPQCTNMEMWDIAKSIARGEGTMISGLSVGGYLSIYASSSYLENKVSSSLKCIGGVAPQVDFRNYKAYRDEEIELQIKPHVGFDTSPQKLAEISPTAQFASGNWKQAKAKDWYLLYVNNDELLPFDTTRELTSILQNSGTKLKQTVLTGDPFGGGHRVDTMELIHHLQTDVLDCFAKN